MTRLPPLSTLFPYTTLFRSLFGDIVTDLAAAVGGGIGLAASGNVNPTGAFPSMFEPVHRSESTRLNSSHVAISYAVFCLKKKDNEGMRILNKKACVSTGIYS